MNTLFKPEGHNSVSPYIVVANSEQQLKFIINTFDAKQICRYDNEDGLMMHAEIKIDDSVMMLSTANDNFPANISFIHVYVPDVKTTFGKAIKNGGTSVQVPTVEEGDSDMRGMFTDPFGNVWAIATHNVRP